MWRKTKTGKEWIKKYHQRWYLKRKGTAHHKELQNKNRRKYYEKHKEEISKKRREYYLKNRKPLKEKVGPEEKIKERARSYTHWALRSGKIRKPINCEKCGLECKTEIHHKNYFKPMDIQFLCSPCHRSIRL